ncbi:MAG TPA: TIGR00266 family protein [Thermoanaerobaculia bacterium]|nr:TIGR00266 family protein [Thermoanaerobaculia bacterium]
MGALVDQWYVAVSGKQEGPFSAEEVVRRIRAGQVPRSAHVFAQGLAAWAPVTSRAEFSAAFGRAAVPPPPAFGGSTAHEIDYEIFGEEMQYVEITLDPREACVAEAGAFMYMDPAIEMETIFGDGSSKDGAGFMGLLMSAGKRVLTGESLFMTVFANNGGSRQKVAFASPYPGKIVPLDLRQLGGTIVCQKDAFLCAAKGISIGIAFQRKLGAGFFGGEGFILQKLDGDGLAFVHAGGTIAERELAAGETLRIDTGCLVALEPRVNYDIQFVGGIKTALFGGEGLFFATLQGPGKVWLQSLPFSRFASRVFSAMPGNLRGRRKGEGSILGPLGDLLGGD